MKKMQNITKKLIHGPFLSWKPREAQKTFPLEICECRYVELSQWEGVSCFSNVWHIYWNAKRGARILFNNTIYELNPNVVLLIPSHTPFAKHLKGIVPHFFIDFTAGSCFKKLKRKVYTFPAGFIKKNLETWLSPENLMRQPVILNHIVWHYLSELGNSDFLEDDPESDFRIARAIDFMENNIGTQYSIKKISSLVNMSLNNFYILFKKETGQTPKKFWAELRLRHIGFMLVHTDASIDEIAANTAFIDRYHFSTYFKNRTGLTPVRFRKTYRK